MQTIAELPEFIKSSRKLLDDDERQDLIRYLSEQPKAGDLIKRNELSGLVALLVAIWKDKNK
ncbi:MAG: hypothetical protein QM533_12365 [Cytophagales bacterium]|nr:hypothetical protein [Cytophagales bacterium]